MDKDNTLTLGGATQAAETMTGAQMVIRALKDQGVTHIFGYPGGAVLPIYDALFKVEGITHVLVRHEQGAVHAAEGYARSTGKPGVVLVTSGPGATNAVTGLTDRSEEHTSELQSHVNLVCRLLLEKKKKNKKHTKPDT